MTGTEISSQPNQVLSSSLKKAHHKAANDNYQKSIDAGFHSDIVNTYLQDEVIGYDLNFTIEKWPTENLRFDPSLRSALSKTCSQIQSVLTKAANYHNTKLVGLKAIDVLFMRNGDEEQKKMLSEGLLVFKQAGEFLANRHKKSDRLVAMSNFISKVMAPLERLVFNGDDKSYLQFLLEPMIDLLGRTYFKGLFGGVITLTEQNNPSMVFRLDNKVVAPDPQLQKWINLFNCGQLIQQPYYLKSLYEHFQNDDAYAFDSEKSVSMISDMYELTPYFLKGWDSKRHGIPLSDGNMAYISFKAGEVFVYLVPEEFTETHQISSYGTACTWDLTNGAFEWALDATWTSPELNHFGFNLLHLVHDHFLNLYLESSIELGAGGANDIDENSSEFFTITAHQHFAEIEAAHISSEPAIDLNTQPNASIVPSLRIQPFLSFMKKEHECYVEQGKGSEIKIWKEGSRIYTIGRHKRNPTIPAWLIRKVIRRIGISEQSWLASLDRL